MHNVPEQFNHVLKFKKFSMKQNYEQSLIDLKLKSLPFVNNFVSPANIPMIALKIVVLSNRNYKINYLTFKRAIRDYRQDMLD